MKYIFIFLFLLSGIMYSQTNNNMEKINSIIKEVQQKYAPDKRTAVFSIEPEAVENNIVLKGETDLPAAKEELLDKLKSAKISAGDEIEMLPEKELGDKIYGAVDLSACNIRTKPANSAEMATQALLGTPIKVLKKKGGWYYVQTPDMYLGWTDDDAFAPMTKAELDSWNNAKKVIYTHDYGKIYSEASETSQPVSDVVMGDILKMIGSDNGFVKVEFPGGRTGFISESYVNEFTPWLKSRKPSADNIIATAKTFMGIPYLWGGTSIKAMDCSGFTKTSFFMHGIMLPRDASQQVNVGTPVDTKDGLDNLKPGDLLFFGRKATETSKERVTHVAIYIGNGEFIHESGRVKINSLDKNKKNFSAYRYNSFLRAKRILNSLGENGVKLLSNTLY